MRSSLLLFSIFIFSSCSLQQKETKTTADTTAVAPEDIKPSGPQIDFSSVDVVKNENTFTLPIESFTIERDKLEGQALPTLTNVKRDGNKLIFQLKNGATKTLTDNTIEGEDYITYSFIKSFDAIGQWQLLCTYYEGMTYLLLDQNDGAENFIWSDPAFSPDKKYFMCSSMDIEAGFIPNGFQLWEMKDLKPFKVWERELNDWGMSRIIWTKDNQIVGEQTYRDEETGENKKRLAKLSLVWAENL